MFDTNEEYDSFVQERFPELMNEDATNEAVSSRMAPFRWFHGIHVNASSVDKWGYTSYINASPQRFNYRRPRVRLKDGNYRTMMSLHGGESYRFTWGISAKYVSNSYNNKTAYVTILPCDFNGTARILNMFDGGQFGGQNRSFYLDAGIGRQGIWNRRVNVPGGVSSFKYRHVGHR